MDDLTPTKMENFAESFKDTVHIYVGERTPQSRPYIVPKSMLCRYEYFRAALSPRWNQNNVLEYPEDTEKAWSVLIYYFLHGKVEWSEATCSDVEEYQGDDNLLTLTRAWLLAQKYQLPRLQNKIMRTLMDGCAEHKFFHIDSTYVEFFSLIEVDCPIRWLVLESIVLWIEVYSDGDISWNYELFEGLMAYDNAWSDLMACRKAYLRSPEIIWRYEDLPENHKDAKKFFVEEPEEDRAWHEFQDSRCHQSW